MLINSAPPTLISIEQGTARSTSRRLQLSLRTFLKDRQNFLGRLRAGQTVAHGPIVQKLGDRGERAEVRLKLILRHDEENDEFHRRGIEGVEFNPSCRSSKSCHYFIEAIGGR